MVYRKTLSNTKVLYGSTLYVMTNLVFSKVKKGLFILSVITCLFSSCEKQNSSNMISEPDYFPNTVDSYWIYERFDSLTNTVDTVNVSISGDTIISADTYKVWEYKYNDKIEKLYVFQKFDSIIYFNVFIERIDQLYVIPFESGPGWVNPDYPFDSSFVSTIENVVIDDTTYEDAVLIQRSAYCCNDYLMEKIWFKPQVGLVKLERNHFILGPYKNETWKLIENNIQ